MALENFVNGWNDFDSTQTNEESRIVCKCILIRGQSFNAFKELTNLCHTFSAANTLRAAVLLTKCL